MRIAPRRQTALIGITLVIVTAGIALMLPAAASVRQAVVPRLPVIVIALAMVSGAWQLTTGVAKAIARGGFDAESAIALLLGASAICMAWAFLPSAPRMTPRLFPLLGSALFAAAAAALSHVERARHKR